MNKSTISMATIEGFPVMIPNQTKDYGSFYISYNNYDTHIYGCDTTALVVGQMEKFFILNGDHREAYDKLSDQGFDACLKYFIDNSDSISKYSEKI